jgi:hypothetical protein
VVGRGIDRRRSLSQATGLPVIELDSQFWRPDLTATPPQEWRQRQQRLVASDRWIIDGDLGPHDTPSVRLNRPTRCCSSTSPWCDAPAAPRDDSANGPTSGGGC